VQFVVSQVQVFAINLIISTPFINQHLNQIQPPPPLYHHRILHLSKRSLTVRQKRWRGKIPGFCRYY